MARLLLINPNTSSAITAQVERTIAPWLPASAQIVAVTARFGVPVIASAAAAAIAAHAALDAYAHACPRGGSARTLAADRVAFDHTTAASAGSSIAASDIAPLDGPPFDAILLACFGDAGQFALREVSDCPVFTLVEPALADTGGVPFSIVTGGARWPAMLRRLLAQIAPHAALVSIETLGADSAAVAAAGAGCDALLLAAIEAAARQGAQRVIVGGAALAGVAARLQPSAAVPLIDCVQSAAAHIGALLAGPARGPAQAEPAPAVTGVATTGLSAALAALLQTQAASSEP